METDLYQKKGVKFHTPFVIGLGYLGKKIIPPKKHVLIPCMMKSGSTLLASILAEHEGLRRTRLVPAWGRREQELSEIRLLRYHHTNYVAQHHIKNSEWTQELIKRYNLKTIIQVRNLFDIVISLRDHIRKEGPAVPVAQFTKEHALLPDAELEEAIVYLAMPWFIQFYAGWRMTPDTMIIRYKDLITDTEDTVRQVLDYAEIATDEEKIRVAIEKAQGVNTRLNKGISGRGQSLTPDLKQQIIRMLDFYPHIQNDPYVLEMREQANA